MGPMMNGSFPKRRKQVGSRKDKMNRKNKNEKTVSEKGIRSKKGKLLKIRRRKTEEKRAPIRT
jgi:hypothetical protein